jgi:hypothetical protein
MTNGSGRSAVDEKEVRMRCLEASVFLAARRAEVVKWKSVLGWANLMYGWVTGVLPNPHADEDAEL